MIGQLKQKILTGKQLTKEEALALANTNGDKLMNLLKAANQIKNEFNGPQVNLCSIVNAKSGSCTEDCQFCAQSSHYDTKVDTYPLLEKETILTKAKQMEAKGAHHFGLVTSGQQILSDQEFNQLLAAIEKINKETKLNVCASLGTLNHKQASALAEAGLTRYNHNLETSQRYFPQICTTHSYKERKKTVKQLKKQDIEVCCGGIIGLGEEFKDRIELAFTLKKMDVDSVPLNILTPIEGTPLEDNQPLPPLEILKTAAIFRFILPEKTIKLCGGRENNLRSLQSLALLAGVNGLLIGNYLTTNGRKIEDDLQMIKDLNLSS